LFDEVHGAIGRFARANADVDVVIKLKWDGEWRSRVEQAIRRQGIEPEDLINLKILAGASAGSLVQDSDVVVSFGSTIILEAGLAGKAVIVPVFAEASHPDYAPFFPMQDCLTGVDVVGSSTEMNDLISKRLKLYEVDRLCLETRKRNFEQYLGPVSDSIEIEAINLIQKLAKAERI
jgi:hypothetical protein